MIWWWYWNDMGMMWGRSWSAFLQALIGVASISGKHHHGMKNDFTWVGNLSCTGCAANIRSHKLTANVWSPCLTRDSDYGLVAGPMRAPLPWCAAYQDCCGFQRHIRVVWRLLLDCKTTIPHRHPSPSPKVGSLAKGRNFLPWPHFLDSSYPKGLLSCEASWCLKATVATGTWRRSHLFLLLIENQRSLNSPWCWVHRNLECLARLTLLGTNQTEPLDTVHRARRKQLTLYEMSRHFMTVWPFPLKQTPRVFSRSHAPWPVAATSYAAEPAQRCHSGLEAWREEMNLKSLEIREEICKILNVSLFIYFIWTLCGDLWDTVGPLYWDKCCHWTWSQGWGSDESGLLKAQGFWIL